MPFHGLFCSGAVHLALRAREIPYYSWTLILHLWSSSNLLLAVPQLTQDSRMEQLSDVTQIFLPNDASWSQRAPGRKSS